MARDSGLAGELAPFQAEAAWQLGQWQDLNQYCREGSQPCWEMDLSRVVLAAYRADRTLFQREIKAARKDILKTLSAVSSEQSAYSKSYLHIGRLAMLREVETVTERLLLVKPGGDGDTLVQNLGTILDEFESRLNYTQISWSNLEPILRLRRGIFNAGN